MLNSDFLVLPGYIDFSADDVVSFLFDSISVSVAYIFYLWESEKTIKESDFGSHVFNLLLPDNLMITGPDDKLHEEDSTEGTSMFIPHGYRN